MGQGGGGGKGGEEVRKRQQRQDAEGYLLVPRLHEKLPAPRCIHWVHISNVHVAQVHSAYDITQSCQQDSLTLKVEGSHTSADDSQHRVQRSVITAGAVAGLNVNGCDWFSDSGNRGRRKGGDRACLSAGHSCSGDCSSGCWECEGCLRLLSKGCNGKEQCCQCCQSQVMSGTDQVGNWASEQLLCKRFTAALL